MRTSSSSSSPSMSIRPRHAVDFRHAVDPSMPHHKPLRMQGWDFTSPGWYFLTICTQNMKPAFGTVVNGRMVLNAAGTIADKFWREIPAHFPRAVVDEYIVMPNHVHGLLNLTACREAMEEIGGVAIPLNNSTACSLNSPTAPPSSGSTALPLHSPMACLLNSSTACRGGLEAFGKPVAGSVSTIVRSYKAAVSRALGESVWQSRFYEVRARDDAARTNIRRYIRENPHNYDAVINGGEPQFLGNKALLDTPKVGFLASRGQTTLHGKLPIKSGETIISGFLSPMERAVFNAGLAHKRPMIWVRPLGLDVAINTDTACRGPIEKAIIEGRLLLLSPFDPTLDAPNARRAAWCNQYVLAHCERLVIGHLNPDGMLACILTEANPDKEIIYL